MPRRKKPKHVGWRVTMTPDDNGELIIREHKLYDTDVEEQETQWADEPVIEFPGGPDAAYPPPVS